jgi:hypothetical protein
VSEFRDAFMRARRRVDEGEDPELVVPEVIAVAEAPEEIAMAERLYGDVDANADDQEDE